jgi:hypothetical protein
MAWGIVMAGVTLFGMLALLIANARMDDGFAVTHEIDRGPDREPQIMTIPRTAPVAWPNTDELKKAA